MNFLIIGFCPFGPAKKEIVHVLTRHIERGWILTNPMNPSTKRILSIKVKDIVKNEFLLLQPNIGTCVGGILKEILIPFLIEKQIDKNMC